MSLVLFLFGFSLVQAFQNVPRVPKYISTPKIQRRSPSTPGTEGPPHLSKIQVELLKNMTHYDWSLEPVENNQYNYPDPWWPTIDQIRGITESKAFSQTPYTSHLTTEELTTPYVDEESPALTNNTATNLTETTKVIFHTVYYKDKSDSSYSTGTDEKGNSTLIYRKNSTLRSFPELKMRVQPNSILDGNLDRIAARQHFPKSIARSRFRNHLSSIRFINELPVYGDDDDDIANYTVNNSTSETTPEAIEKKTTAEHTDTHTDEPQNTIDYFATTPAAMTVLQDTGEQPHSFTFDLNVMKDGFNKSMNIVFNKFVEKMNLNVAGNTLDAMDAIKISGLVKKYFEEVQQSSTVDAPPSDPDRMHRQGPDDFTTLRPPMFSDMLSTTTESPASTTSPPLLIPSTTPDLLFTTTVPLPMFSDLIPTTRVPDTFTRTSSTLATTTTTTEAPTTAPTTTSAETPSIRPGQDWAPEIIWNPVNLEEEMVENMKKYGFGPFSEFLRTSCRILFTKPANHVRLLLFAVEDEHKYLATEDKVLTIFGPKTKTTIEMLSKYIHQAKLEFLQSKAVVIMDSLTNRRAYMTPKVNQLFDYVDSMYNEEETTALFKATNLLYLYPNTTQNHHEVLRAVTQTFFAPFKRLSGTPKKQILVQAIETEFEKAITAPPEGADIIQNELEAVQSLKSQRRYFTNKTRFSIVGREDDPDTDDDRKVDIKTTRQKKRLRQIFQYLTTEKRVLKDDDKAQYSTGRFIKKFKDIQKSDNGQNMVQLKTTKPFNKATKRKVKPNFGFNYKKYSKKPKTNTKNEQEEKEFEEYQDTFTRINMQQNYKTYSKFKASKLKGKLSEQNKSNTILGYDSDYPNENENKSKGGKKNNRKITTRKFRKLYNKVHNMTNADKVKKTSNKRFKLFDKIYSKENQNHDSTDKISVMRNHSKKIDVKGTTRKIEHDLSQKSLDTDESDWSDDTTSSDSKTDADSTITVEDDSKNKFNQVNNKKVRRNKKYRIMKSQLHNETSKRFRIKKKNEITIDLNPIDIDITYSRADKNRVERTQNSSLYNSFNFRSNNLKRKKGKPKYNTDFIYFLKEKLRRIKLEKEREKGTSNGSLVFGHLSDEVATSQKSLPNIWRQKVKTFNKKVSKNKKKLKPNPKVSDVKVTKETSHTTNSRTTKHIRNTFTEKLENERYFSKSTTQAATKPRTIIVNLDKIYKTGIYDKKLADTDSNEQIPDMSIESIKEIKRKIDSKSNEQSFWKENTDSKDDDSFNYTISSDEVRADTISTHSLKTYIYVFGKTTKSSLRYKHLSEKFKNQTKLQVTNTPSKMLTEKEKDLSYQSMEIYPIKGNSEMKIIVRKPLDNSHLKGDHNLSYVFLKNNFNKDKRIHLTTKIIDKMVLKPKIPTGSFKYIIVQQIGNVNDSTKVKGVMRSEFTNLTSGETFRAATDAVDKINEFSSYSDEEKSLKFHLNDAMRHNDAHLRNIRRHNVFIKVKDKKHKLNDFSSYSSEEIVLKSNIYKVLGFQNFTNDKLSKRARDVEPTKRMKWNSVKFKPVNELSSYSDEEGVLKNNLKV